jgi:hypothetical protein
VAGAVDLVEIAHQVAQAGRFGLRAAEVAGALAVGGHEAGPQLGLDLGLQRRAARGFGRPGMAQGLGQHRVAQHRRGGLRAEREGGQQQTQPANELAQPHRWTPCAALARAAACAATLSR